MIVSEETERPSIFKYLEIEKAEKRCTNIQGYETL